ncbi:MAG TPA: hypothetical protein VE870_14440 [Bacteroidales bacterium]|nr:hypothetical protein [Bacteroidales bacterium]
MRTVFQIILGIAILVLAYFVYDSILTPIRFNKAKDVRENKTISRMEQIREAQKAYKDVNTAYTGSFDTLIYFLKNDSFAITKAIGTIPEDLIDSVGITKARNIALKRGIIKRSVTKIPVMDSLYGKSFPVDSLQYVPFTKGKRFNMKAGEYVTPSNLTVKVVEVSVPYSVLLKGLDPQLVVNYADQRKKITNYPGLKFGSETEGTLTGNWE